jgi:hypothetical protein
MNNIIKRYIKIITIKDVYNFGLKNNIQLNDNELSIVYNIIKNDYEALLNNDENIFKYLEGHISKDNYIKIRNLFNEYKKKYQNYL